MDPIIIIVGALVAGAAAGLTDTAARAVEDAYVGLKLLIQYRYAQTAFSIDMLESDPSSKDLRAFVEKQLTETNAGHDPELFQQAQATINAVARHDPEAARTVGVDLDGIKGVSLKLSDITTTGTAPVTGVRVKQADITGAIEISGVQVGAHTSNPSASSSATKRKIRILFLAANPSDTARLRLDKEVRAIDQALRLAENRDSFAPEQAHAVRAGDLQVLLMRYEPHIVHFSGHGSPAGEVILEEKPATRKQYRQPP